MYYCCNKLRLTCKVCREYVEDCDGEPYVELADSTCLHIHCMGLYSHKVLPIRTIPTSLRDLCTYGVDCVTFQISVNIIYNGMTGLQPQHKLIVSMGTNTSLYDFMTRYYPNLKEENTQIAFGDRILSFEWKNVNIKACFCFDHSINMRIGFKFSPTELPFYEEQVTYASDYVVLSQAFGTEISSVSFSDRYKGRKAVAIGYCSKCKVYTPKLLTVGIYSCEQLLTNCKNCNLRNTCKYINPLNLKYATFGRNIGIKFRTCVSFDMDLYYIIDYVTLYTPYSERLFRSIYCSICFSRERVYYKGRFGNHQVSVCGHAICKDCSVVWVGDCPICNQLWVY